MLDHREKLLSELEEFFQMLEIEDDKSTISNEIVKILSNYEIIQRCTEVAVYDGEDERILKRYTACLRLDGKSDKTIYQYIRTCRRLSELVGKPFKEMGTYDVRYFLALEKDRGISDVSVENARSYISAFFQWMTNEEIINKNPVAKINVIKYKEEIKLPFSDVEIDALRINCTTKKERAILELLLSSGVRVSELTSMKISDIDFQNMTVHVVEGKGNQERMTYTTPLAIKHLMDYLQSRPEDGEYLFYNKDHEPLCSGGVRYILNVLAERSGVNHVHPHRFRRTFATGLAKRGMDIQDIQILLGHKKIETTMLYVYNDAEKVHSSYKKYIA